MTDCGYFDSKEASERLQKEYSEGASSVFGIETTQYEIDPKRECYKQGPYKDSVSVEKALTGQPTKLRIQKRVNRK